MPRHRPYRPFPTRPHTYGVRPWSSSAVATEPCRPTSCVRERPCSPNGESGLGETPSYRASAPAGAGDVGSRSTVHCSLLTVHWTFTFSAKERDSETGLSYFGSRYYSSDLSVWLSVDPQSDKYPSLSPYTYCANNPVRLVDPNGDTLYPSVAFEGSPYYNIYQHLLASNNIYKRLVSGYQGEESHLYLDYSTVMTTKAGHIQWEHKTKGSDVSTTANTTYYRPYGMDQSEIGMVQTLLHEAVHAVDGLTPRKTPNHNGFDQASVLAGLMEYNSTYNLGYSNEDLEFLSWSGLQKSEEYRNYINKRSILNERTFEEEDKYVQSRITLIKFTTNIDD